MTRPAGLPFAAAVVCLATVTAVAVVASPNVVASVAVAVFAGPHNWLEFRYAVRRMPARAGKLRRFVAVSAVGVVSLTILFAALPLASDARVAYAVWGTAVIGWAAYLVRMRANTPPRFDGGLVVPIACLVCAVVWAWPEVFGLALLFAHPLLALVLLDRELTRSHRHWRPAFRVAVACVPALAVGVGLAADGFYDSSVRFSRPVFAAHTFLEVVHYSVWVVLMPSVALGKSPWRTADIPLARRGHVCRHIVVVALLVGASAVVALWVAFAIEPSATLSVYFTVAMAHVLAEIPLLLRML